MALADCCHQKCGSRSWSSWPPLLLSHQIREKEWEYSGTVRQLFIDVKEVCVSVRREVLYNILIEFGILRN
jgi:hypothetical protein